MSDITPEQGAGNLLLNCAKARSGNRLLIVYEPEELGYYDAASVDIVAQAARDLNLFTTKMRVGFSAINPTLSEDLLEQMQMADIVLFLARLGDQLRFSQMPKGKTIIVCFALSRDMFSSGFANGHHDAFLQLRDAVNTVLANASQVHVTCPNGTDFHGKPMMNLTPSGDTTILRFPMSVFTPVPAHSFSGCVALPGFLTGTGSQFYDDYTIHFDRQVWALLDEGRLAGFEGAANDVARAEAHYDKVAAQFGIDRNFVHSWHAGIHPGCGYPWEASENFERWGGAAFGNPRILHFHTCGAYAPGEISWNVIDPTVVVDGLTLWDNGYFHAERLPQGPEILTRFPCAAQLFANPDRNIGFRRIA